MTIDLQKFVAPDTDGRVYLRQPWSVGDFTYSTNGRVAVRVARHTGVPENPKAPDMGKVMANFATDGFVPLSDLVNVEHLPAPSEEECDDCEGTAVAHRCPSCACTCSGCNGTGVARETSSVRLAGSIVQTRYLRLIAKLPNCCVSPAKSENLPISFTFDGGVGLLMQLRAPSPLHYEASPSGAGFVAVDRISR